MQALSHNEIKILDRQVATMTYQLSEIARSLESRLGVSNDLAASARRAEYEFGRFAERVRRRIAFPGDEPPEAKSQPA